MRNIKRLMIWILAMVLLVMPVFAIPDYEVNVANATLGSGCTASSNYNGYNDCSRTIENMFDINARWLTMANEYAPHWIRIYFNKNYTINQTKIYNNNQGTVTDRGLRNVTIYYSLDDISYIKLMNFELIKGNCENTTCASIPMNISFIPVYARFFIINASTVWSGNDPAFASLWRIEFINGTLDSVSIPSELEGINLSDWEFNNTYFNSTDIIINILGNFTHNNTNCSLFINNIFNQSSLWDAQNNADINYSFGISEGDYIINISCINTISNASKVFNFGVDITYPLIEYITPPLSDYPYLFPVENDTYLGQFKSRNWIFLNYSIIENNLDGCEMHLTNATDDDIFIVYNETSYNFTDLPQTVYAYGSGCFDKAGNLNMSDIRMTFLDTISPTNVYGALTETNNSVFTDRNNIFVNLLINDYNGWYGVSVYNISIRLYNESGLKGSAIQTFSIFEWSSMNYYLQYNFTDLSNGIYYFNGAVCDRAFNCNTTETRMINISMPYAPPVPPSNVTIGGINIFGTDSCPLDKSIAWVLGYFSMIFFVLLIFVINLFFIKIPFISIAIGFGFIFLTLPLYACSWMVGGVFTLFAFIIMFYDAIYVFRG